MPEWFSGSLARSVGTVAVGGIASSEVGLAELAERVERQAKLNANTGSHRPSEPHVPGTGPGPNVVTGNLRRNVTHENVKRDARGLYVRVGIAWAAPYARYLETGLRNGAKYPFLLPAAHSVTRDAGVVWRQSFHI